MPPRPLAGATPVRFEDASADALVAALEDAADALDAVVRAEIDRLGPARADWRGYSRNWFEREHGALLGEIRSAAAACRRAADDVRLAKQRAWTLQDVRNQDAVADLLRRVEHQQARAAWSHRAAEPPR